MSPLDIFISNYCWLIMGGVCIPVSYLQSRIKTTESDIQTFQVFTIQFSLSYVLLPTCFLFGLAQELGDFYDF